MNGTPDADRVDRGFHELIVDLIWIETKLDAILKEFTVDNVNTSQMALEYISDQVMKLRASVTQLRDETKEVAHVDR